MPSVKITHDMYPCIKYLSCNTEQAIAAGFPFTFSPGLAGETKNLARLMAGLIIGGNSEGLQNSKFYYFPTQLLQRLTTKDWTDTYGAFFRFNIPAQSGAFILGNGYQMIYLYPDQKTCGEFFGTTERVLSAAAICGNMYVEAEAAAIKNRDMLLINTRDPDRDIAGSLIRPTLQLMLHIDHYRFSAQLPPHFNSTRHPVYIVT